MYTGCSGHLDKQLISKVSKVPLPQSSELTCPAEAGVGVGRHPLAFEAPGRSWLGGRIIWTEVACDGKSRGGAHLGLVLGRAHRLRVGELGPLNPGWPLRRSGPPGMWLDPTPGPGKALLPRQRSEQQRFCSLVLPKAASSAWMAPTVPHSPPLPHYWILAPPGSGSLT